MAGRKHHIDSKSVDMKKVPGLMKKDKDENVAKIVAAVNGGISDVSGAYKGANALHKKSDGIISKLKKVAPKINDAWVEYMKVGGLNEDLVLVDNVFASGMNGGYSTLSGTNFDPSDRDTFIKSCYGKKNDIEACATAKLQNAIMEIVIEKNCARSRVRGLFSTYKKYDSAFFKTFDALVKKEKTNASQTVKKHETEFNRICEIVEKIINRWEMKKI